MASERLQKIMAALGIASRRKAEEIIAAGRVTVNGKGVVEGGGKLDKRAIEGVRAGITIELEDGARVKTSPAKIRLVEDGANPWYEVILIEGRNRQIRRMFQRVGFLVEKIKRVQLGPLALDVPPGKYRALTVREGAKLKSL